MSNKINYSKNIFKKPTSNLVLFCDDKFSINKLKRILSSSEYSYISDLLKIVI